MKICLISHSHLDATIPLAKYLSIKDEVSLYCIFSNNEKDMDVINLTNNEPDKSIVNDKHCYKYIEPELLKYIGNNFQLNIIYFKYSNYGTISFINTLFKLRNAIDVFNPDIINIIGHQYFLKIIHLALWSYPRVHTAHEVIAHNRTMDLYNTSKLLRYLVKKNQYFIFPSKVTSERFHKTYKMSESHTSQIYVGNHQLYKLYKDENIISGSNTILFFGKISPYKGLHYLIEAAKYCSINIPGFKLIIAGKGDINYKNINQLPFIEIINRELTNHEVAYYIQMCKIVVCPYTSASSSGIPLSAYVFNKPVIASDIPGLNESVHHMETGLLFSPKDTKALARSIELLLLDNSLYNNIVSNIKSGKYNPEMEWQYISDKTRGYYSSVISRPISGKISFNNKRRDLAIAGISCIIRMPYNIIKLARRLANRRK